MSFRLSSQNLANEFQHKSFSLGRHHDRSSNSTNKFNVKVWRERTLVFVTAIPVFSYDMLVGNGNHIVRLYRSFLDETRNFVCFITNAPGFLLLVQLIFFNLRRRFNTNRVFVPMRENYKELSLAYLSLKLIVNVDYVVPGESRRINHVIGTGKPCLRCRFPASLPILLQWHRHLPRISLRTL